MTLHHGIFYFCRITGGCGVLTLADNGDVLLRTNTNPLIPIVYSSQSMAAHVVGMPRLFPVPEQNLPQIFDRIEELRDMFGAVCVHHQESDIGFLVSAFFLDDDTTGNVLTQYIRIEHLLRQFETVFDESVGRKKGMRPFLEVHYPCESPQGYARLKLMPRILAALMPNPDDPAWRVTSYQRPQGEADGTVIDHPSFAL